LPFPPSQPTLNFCLLFVDILGVWIRFWLCRYPWTDFSMLHEVGTPARERHPPSQHRGPLDRKQECQERHRLLPRCVPACYSSIYWGFGLGFGSAGTRGRISPCYTRLERTVVDNKQKKTNKILIKKQAAVLPFPPSQPTLNSGSIYYFFLLVIRRYIGGLD
jgi:hypothetical protein